MAAANLPEPFQAAPLDGIAGMIDWLRAELRKRLWWIKFRELNREGWKKAWVRHRIQNAILRTPPLRTGREGDIEVRALTWRRDWKNLIWALKSFYHFSGCAYPLYIHDGGLTEEGRTALRAHFPDAHFPSREEAEARVEEAFNERHLDRCRAYRKKNTTTFKLFDFFLMSQARTVFSIDSDIVFFQSPDELLDAHPGQNLYNHDEKYWYSMSLDELEACFGIRPIPYLNSGLARIERESIDFESIEEWLAEPRLFTDDWVTEQTLHALCSMRHGVELLSPLYMVSTKPGFLENVVCKHYPGNLRPLLYEEGMRRLVQSGFLTQFGKAAPPPASRANAIHDEPNPA